MLSMKDLAGIGTGYRPNLGDYRTSRSKDPHGQVLNGLRCARDRRVAATSAPWLLRRMT